MKTLVYIHMFFKTPASVGGLRSYYLSRMFAENFDKVVIITTGINANSRDKEYLRSNIEVIRLKGAYKNEWSFFRKSRAFISFSLRAFFKVVRLKDVIGMYVTSTPLFVGIPALGVKWMRGIPYVFEVRDVWPQVAVDAKVLTNPFLIGGLELLERTIYRFSAGVVALSPGMSSLVRSKNDKIPIVTAYNMSFFESYRKKSIDSKLRLVYFGSLNRSNGFADLVVLIETIAGRDDVSLDIYTYKGGYFYENLLQYQGSGNVNIFDPKPWIELKEVLCHYDFSLVLFDKNVPALATNSPNKMFDSLSIGLPVVVNTSGWMKEAVQKHDLGLFLDRFDAIDTLIDGKNLFSSERVFNVSKDLYSAEVISKRIKNFVNENIASSKRV